jgi:hypothetical protein
MKEPRELIDMTFEVGEFKLARLDRTPFRVSALVFAGAALEIAKALHRIATEMERRPS